MSFSFILFASLNIVPLWIVLIIIIRDIIITLLRSIREFEGKYFKTSYIAKVKTFVQMSYIFLILLILLLLTFDIDLEYKNMLQKFILINNPVNYSVILLVTVITIYTGISYFFERNPKVEIN